MRIFKKILRWTFIIVVLLNIAVFISGKQYLYKAIANTYLMGRASPAIDEYKIFDNAEVKNGSFQQWPLSKFYNSVKVAAALQEKMNYYGSVSFLVIKNDSIRYEQYWENYDQNSVSNSFSMAKTFVSILTGIAIDQGKIKNIDQPVGDFLPEFSNGENKKVTIKHLLTMSSGINFDEDYVNPFAYPAAAYYGSDLKKLTFNYKVTKEPGRIFEYLSGNTEILGFVLEKATGMSLSTYASEKLWKPLGAKNPAFWGLDHQGGVEKAYCCFNSNARDFARIGQLFLKQGNWKGQQILSKQYVNTSIHPADIIGENGQKNKNYGLSWWLINYKNNPIYYARGILGQYIFVVPDKNMVIVRLGHKRDKHLTEGHPDDIFYYLDAAFEM